jgi:hypothetical protein
MACPHGVSRVGQLRTLTSYNYEAPLRQFYITVIASNELLTSSLACLVTVVDINEPPVVLPTMFTIDEDDAFPLTSLGVLNAVDEDAGTICLFSVLSIALTRCSH